MIGPWRSLLCRFALTFFIVRDVVEALVMYVGERESLPNPTSVAAALHLDVLGTPTGKLLVAVPLGLALAAFVLKRGSWWVALAIVGLKAVCYHAMMSCLGDVPPRDLHFLTAAVVLGYGAVYLIADVRGVRATRLLEPDPREHTAREVAIAIIAAVYVLAGLSKLIVSGADWVNPWRVQITSLAYLATDTSWRAALLELLQSAPWLFSAMNAATLVIELGAFVAIPWPRLRGLVAISVIGMHTGIWVLTNIVYVPWIVVVAVFFPEWRWRQGAGARAEPMGSPEAAR